MESESPGFGPGCVWFENLPKVLLMHTQPGQVGIPLAGAQYSAWLGHARAVWLHRSYLPSLSCHPLIGKNGRNELDLMLLDAVQPPAWPSPSPPPPPHSVVTNTMTKLLLPQCPHRPAGDDCSSVFSGKGRVRMKHLTHPVAFGHLSPTNDLVCSDLSEAVRDPPKSQTPCE